MSNIGCDEYYFRNYGFQSFNFNFYIPDSRLFILQNSVSIILMYLKIDVFFFIHVL